MTKKAQLAIELSTKRQRVNELLGLDDGELTTEQRSEMDGLTVRLQEIEPELRAAIVAEETAQTVSTGEGTAESRELRAMVDRASVGAIFAAVVEHRATEGPEAELQKHLGLSGNQVPLGMLVEHRAVTPAPADVGATQSPIVPGVFPQSASAFLGVDQPTVAVGDAVFPVLTTNASVHTPDEGAAAAESTGSFAGDALVPKRLQSSFRYSREDRARFFNLDAALRDNLSMALGDGLDKQVISGPEGLLTGAKLANHNVDAVTTFDLYLAGLAYSRVDGTYASEAGDLRILVGSAAYGHAGRVYRNASVDRSALDRLLEVTGGVRVSAHVPAAAANKQNTIVRRGMRRDMVAPIWEGVSLIPDEITKAADGEIVITAVMLHAVKILRADGFYKQQIQVA